MIAREPWTGRVPSAAKVAAGKRAAETRRANERRLYDVRQLLAWVWLRYVPADGMSSARVECDTALLVFAALDVLRGGTR